MGLKVWRSGHIERGGNATSMVMGRGLWVHKSQFFHPHHNPTYLIHTTHWITYSKGTKRSKNSSGNMGQSDLKSSAGSVVIAIHPRATQEGAMTHTPTARSSNDWKEAIMSQASPNIDDDDDNDQLPQPSRRRTVTVPRILRESQVSTSFDDDKNDDNNGGNDDGDSTTSTCESGNRRESLQLSNATSPSNQEHAWQLQKRDRSPVDIGCRLKRKVGNIGVSKVWWDVAHDVFFCGILTEDPYPTDVDTLSAESFEQVRSYLKEALQGDISTTAIHMLADRQSAAKGIFADQAREIVPDHYIDIFCNMSNNDWQKQVARLTLLALTGSTIQLATMR
ncbi:hypothetical protein BDD12DRAFT_807843 [Trichophaea hybrida]|nr:hypothetical protein BDD12DRAFT_807843 [Trichophaea hybrida]